MEYRSVLLLGGPIDGQIVEVHELQDVYYIFVLKEAINVNMFINDSQPLPEPACERKRYVQTELDRRIFKFEE